MEEHAPLSTRTNEAGAVARTLADLAELVDKYRLLEALRRAEPGRTEARRQAMRAIADRFPGALREWDEAPAAELTRRREEVEAMRARLGRDGTRALADFAAPHNDWMRFAIAVHARLRQALEAKRLLGGHPTAARLDEVARALGLPRERVSAIASPRSGRMSEAVHHDVAREAGVPVETLKAALFPRAEPAAPPELAAPAEADEL